MRVVLLLTLLALSLGAPVAAADDGATSPSSSTSDPATTSSSGPEPTGCRPYCLAAGE